MEMLRFQYYFLLIKITQVTEDLRFLEKLFQS